MRWISRALVVFVVLATATGALAQGNNRIGAGAHYWRTIDDIRDDDYDLENDGVAWVISYQRVLVPLLRLEADLEIFPDGFGGSSETTYAPQAYAIVGAGIYAAVGVGINYADSEFADDPFYVLRAGIDIEVLPSIHLDVNANYIFVDWDNLQGSDIDTDTVTLGAAVRLAF